MYIIVLKLTGAFQILAGWRRHPTRANPLLIKVIDCSTYFYILHSFTPNNDGKNDIFKLIVTGKLEQYQFSI